MTIMSLPAALTWLQLLPEGTQFSCAGAPAWLVEMLREHTNGENGASRAIVKWGEPWSDLADDVTNSDAVVAINCPQVTTSRLIAAGYSYARRFAVLPSLQNARWFISLDTTRAAAASFSLYTPSRKSAHVKKAIARMLAKLRVPGWYRDEIVVAARATPPLATKMTELFPEHTIRLALSSGAPEPAINRKPSASVIDVATGEVLGFVKIAASKVSRDIVEHEAETLAGLALRDLKLATPRLLFAGEVDGRYIAVQSPLPGSPAPAAFTPQHAEFLQALRCGASKPAAETNMVVTLPHRLDALRPARPQLREICDSILPTLEQTPVVSTIVHGDFAPWNLRTHAGKIAAFDWEYAELDGLPLIDQIHFRLQLGLEMEKWDLAAAAAFLREMSDDAFDAAQIRAIQAVYLLDNLARLYGEGYSADHDMVALYQDLLKALPIRRREAALV
jgi:hypothetical protein